jgi:hypothetical protein
MDADKLLAMVKSKQRAMTKRDRTKKLSPGKNRIRVLPGWRPEEPERFFQDFGQHFIKGDDGEVKAVYICTEKTFGKPCDVCGALGKAMKATRDDDLVKVLGEAKASERILVNAIWPEDAESPNDPQISELPPTVFKQILGLFEEWGNVIDPTEGRDVIVQREGKSIATKYTVSPAAKATAVPAAALAKLHNLDQYVDQESVEQQNKALVALAAVSGLSTTTAALALPPSAGDKPATPVAGLIADATPTPTKATDVALDEELEALLTVGE